MSLKSHAIRNVDMIPNGDNPGLRAPNNIPVDVEIITGVYANTTCIIFSGMRVKPPFLLYLLDQSHCRTLSISCQYRQHNVLP